MKCPKCQMDNAKDAAYCAFCYERFRGTSAADTYLQAMKRARAKENGGELPSEPTVDDSAPAPAAPHRTPSTVSFYASVRQSLHAIAPLLRRFWRPLSLLAAGLLILFFIESGLNPSVRFHYFGGRLIYAFPAQAPLTYIFGSTTNAARWSERAQQMDTPLGDLKIEDIATIDASSVRAENKTTAVTVTSKNWLLNIHRTKGTESHLLSEKSGLAPAYVWLDTHGHVMRRQEGASIRVAKSAAFLVVPFPTRRLKENKTWSDTALWTDALDGWAVEWSVQRHWRVENSFDCGEDLCIQLHYEALLTPHVVNEPAWIASAHWHSDEGHGTGEMVFDVTTHTVVSHQLEYADTLRATVADVSRIPSTMRVGRRAFHARGEILFALKNSTSLQRN